MKDAIKRYPQRFGISDGSSNTAERLRTGIRFPVLCGAESPSGCEKNIYMLCKPIIDKAQGDMLQSDWQKEL